MAQGKAGQASRAAARAAVAKIAATSDAAGAALSYGAARLAWAERDLVPAMERFEAAWKAGYDLSSLAEVGGCFATAQIAEREKPKPTPVPPLDLGDGRPESAEEEEEEEEEEPEPGPHFAAQPRPSP